MAAFFAIPAVAGGVVQVVRAATPYIAKQLAKKFGAKKISRIAANKINKNPSTITNVNQLGSKIRTAAGVKPFRPLGSTGTTSSQRSALSDMGGQTVKLSKPTGGAGRANLKPKAPSMKPTTPSMKPKSPSMKPQRPSMKPKPKVVKPSASAPKAPPSRPSVPSGGSRFTGFPRRPTTPKAPPSRPISKTQRAGNVAKQAAVTGTGVAALQKMKPKASTVTGPKSRPSRNAPNYGMPKAKTEGKDPRGNQIKPTPGKMIMPKKFDGGYDSKKQKLVNITVNGKKATYEIPKGMTTKQAKSLLTGTAKKAMGGPVSKTKMNRTTPKKKQMVSNPEYFKASNRAAEKNEGAKNVPKKVKGFSQLPEKVQKKMSPKLAAKYKKGGSIKTDKVARQVKGFGAARKPKK